MKTVEILPVRYVNFETDFNQLHQTKMCQSQTQLGRFAAAFLRVFELNSETRNRVAKFVISNLTPMENFELKVAVPKTCLYRSTSSVVNILALWL